MSETGLRLLVQTPHELVVELLVVSVRVPTETGQVGLRARHEPTVLAVEPGLVLIRAADSLRYVGTAGGILHSEGKVARLLTPLAVAGMDAGAVTAKLEQAMSAPDTEMQARAKLSRLESRILSQVRRDTSVDLDTTRDEP